MIEPLQGGVIILERSREGGFGRQPIVNGYDHAVMIQGNLLHGRNSFSSDTGKKAPTVNMENRRPFTLTRSGIDDEYANVRCSFRPGDCALLAGGRTRRRSRHR